MMLLAGFASGFYMPASNALLADIVPQEMRLRAYAGQRLAINAGFACGASAAGFLITISTFALFAGDAITTALFGLIAWRFLPRGHQVAREETSWAQAWRHIRVDSNFWGLFWATILSSFVFQQFNSTFGLEIKQRALTLSVGHWTFTPEQVFGILLGWNGVMVALFELPLTRWTQKFDSRRIITIGYLLMGFGFALNALHHGVGLFFGGMTLFTIGEMFSQPMRNAYIAQIAPLHLRGRYMGALAMAGTAAGALGPHASLRIHAWNPTVLWIGCAALGILAAITLRPRKSPPNAGH
jgi:MFS family permease